MKDILILPGKGQEGSVYARMLAIVCEDGGFSVAVGEGKEEARLLLVDGDSGVLPENPDHLPVICYGTTPRCPVPGAFCYLYRPVIEQTLLDAAKSLLDPGVEPIVAGNHRLNEFDLGQRPAEAKFRGMTLGLTENEYRLLSYLYYHRGRTITREELVASVWKNRRDATSNIVEAGIKRLRTKLDQRFGRRFIRSVRGVGYRFVLCDEEEEEI